MAWAASRQPTAVRTNPDLDALEHDLKVLRVEFEKYFNGANDLPPADLQTKIDRRIRDLRTQMRSAVDRFRIAGLEHQNSSYNEMFNRRLRVLEEGRTPRPMRPTGHRAPDPEAGVVVRGRISDEALGALFHGLYPEATQRQPPDLDRLRQHIDGQVAAISERTGCVEVRFRLAAEDGKMKLKAKPMRSHQEG